MTAQSALTVVAPVAPERVASLRALLATLNEAPGRADPENPVLPFAAFPELHFARLLVVEDATAADVAAYGEAPRPEPTYLALLADCDGPAEAFLDALAARAGEGLARIFGHCADWAPEQGLRAWMRAHLVREAACYVNWRGRTLRQCREEAALHAAARAWLDAERTALAGRSPREAWGALRAFVDGERRAGRLRLTSPEPTAPGWWLGNAVHLVGVPLAALALSPLLLAGLPLFLYQLRRHERRDAVIAPPVDPEHARRLGALEDHGVTNQFSAMGTLKPGPLRRLALAAAFVVLDYTTRHVYGRGHLARVGTIHFARWIYLPDGRRLLFASSYDGSLDSYMDDFINKVAFGLNLVFSNGVGYPATRWLILDGARDEQGFKSFIRRHELATEVWYDALPGSTAYHLQRNGLLRRALEGPDLDDREAAAALALL